MAPNNDGGTSPLTPEEIKVKAENTKLRRTTKESLNAKLKQEGYIREILSENHELKLELLINRHSKELQQAQQRYQEAEAKHSKALRKAKETKEDLQGKLKRSRKDFRQVLRNLKGVKTQLEEEKRNIAEEKSARVGAEKKLAEAQDLADTESRRAAEEKSARAESEKKLTEARQRTAQEKSACADAQKDLEEAKSRLEHSERRLKNERSRHIQDAQRHAKEKADLETKLRESEEFVRRLLPEAAAEEENEEEGEVARSNQAHYNTRRGGWDWEDRFQQLLEYRKKNGDCLVPPQYIGDPGLGVWVTEQRLEYSGDTLTEERINKLNAIGFQWEFPVAVAASKGVAASRPKKRKSK